MRGPRSGAASTVADCAPARIHFATCSSDTSGLRTCIGPETTTLPITQKEICAGNVSVRRIALALGGWKNKMPLVHSAGNHLAQPRIGFAGSRFELLAAAILLVMALNLVSVIARKSITADEVVLIPSAYYHYVADEVHL